MFLVSVFLLLAPLSDTFTTSGDKVTISRFIFLFYKLSIPQRQVSFPIVPFPLWEGDSKGQGQCDVFVPIQSISC